MKKEQIELLKKPYYTKLLIYTHLRALLWVLVGCFSILTAVFIVENQLTGANWVLLIPPLGLMGVLLMVFPATEDWVYEPWQVHPQQYERHMTDI